MPKFFEGSDENQHQQTHQAEFGLRVLVKCAGEIYLQKPAGFSSFHQFLLQSRRSVSSPFKPYWHPAGGECIRALS